MFIYLYIYLLIYIFLFIYLFIRYIFVTPSLPQTMHITLSFSGCAKVFALLACYALTFSQDISCAESF